MSSAVTWLNSLLDPVQTDDSGPRFSERNYFCQRPKHSHSIQGDPELQVSVAEYPAARMGSVKEEMLSLHGTLSKGRICILSQRI